MPRIEGGAGPDWPLIRTDNPPAGSTGKSAFDNALERGQRGLQHNPLATAPPPEIEPAEAGEENDTARVRPAKGSDAGDNLDHGQDDPYADVDWRIRRQLGL